MNPESRLREVLQGLNFLSLFLDRLERYRYIRPYFSIGISSDPILWSIAKPSLNGYHPSQLFFGEAFKDKSEFKLHIRDWEMDIPGEIEDFYELPSIRSVFPNYDSLNWRNKRFLKKVREKFPEAFTDLDRKREITRRLRREKSLDINVVMECDGTYYIDLAYDVKGMNVKDELNYLFEGIEVLRGIYKELYEAHDEDQIVVFEDDKIELDALREYVYLTRRILGSIEDKLKSTLFISVIDVNNASLSRSIWLELKTENIEKIRITIYDRREEKKSFELVIDVIPYKGKYDEYVRRIKIAYPYAKTFGEVGIIGIFLQVKTQNEIIDKIRCVLEDIC